MNNKKIYLWIILFLLIIIPCVAFGYGGSSYSAPEPEVSDGSLTINNGATTTTSNLVNLQLSATNATAMAISNTADFINVSWEAYNTTKTWSLTTGGGTKTVYLKFHNSSGAVSGVISKDIIFQPPTMVNQPDLNGDSYINDFDFSILMSNWGAPANTAADLNSDGVVNDFDFSMLMSTWSV